MTRPRLLLDADTRPLLATSLRSGGYDAVHAAEVGLAAASDSALLGAASRQDRVLVTHNARDFLHLAREWGESGRSHPGILIARQAPFRVLRRRLLRFLAHRSSQDLRNAAAWLPAFDDPG